MKTSLPYRKCQCNVPAHLQSLSLSHTLQTSFCQTRHLSTKTHARPSTDNHGVVARTCGDPTARSKQTSCCFNSPEKTQRPGDQCPQAFLLAQSISNDYRFNFGRFIFPKTPWFLFFLLLSTFRRTGCSAACFAIHSCCPIARRLKTE
jgi:hypothetical protein